MFEVRFCGENAEFLCIRVQGRSHLGFTADFWDGNWLRSEIEVRAGGFRCQTVADLRAEEFAPFHKQLLKLQKTLGGEATFETLERQLTIHVHGDGRGHMKFKCVLLDQAGIGNKLDFVLESDQTFLAPAISDLGVIVESFPVVGNP